MFLIHIKLYSSHIIYYTCDNDTRPPHDVTCISITSALKNCDHLPVNISVFVRKIKNSLVFLMLPKSIRYSDYFNLFPDLINIISQKQ